MAETLDRTEVRGEAFNFGPAEPRTVNEVVHELRKLMGREDLEPEVLNGAIAEIRHQYLSSEKARKLLAWQPRYTLTQGLSESVAWYRDFFRRAA